MSDSIETKPITVNKWDSNAVKNALDDAIKDILIRKKDFIENHKLMDGRLLISGAAVAVSLYALLWDYLYPFPQSRSVLIVCVAFYFVMMCVLTFYVSYLEKGIFVVAIERDPTGYDPDIRWEVRSTLPKYSDQYALDVSCTVKGKTTEKNVGESVSHFFDEQGTIVLRNVEKTINKICDNLKNKKLK